MASTVGRGAVPQHLKADRLDHFQVKLKTLNRDGSTQDIVIPVHISSNDPKPAAYLRLTILNPNGSIQNKDFPLTMKPQLAPRPNPKQMTEGTKDITVNQQDSNCSSRMGNAFTCCFGKSHQD